MERVSRKNKVVIFLGVFTLVYFLGQPPARSGVVFVDRTDQQMGDDNYPESRFGAQPARPDFGVTRNAGSETQVADTEADAETIGRWNRAPASEETPHRPSATPAVPPVGPAAFDQQKTEPTAGGAGAPSISTPEMQAAAIRRKGVQEVALIAGDLGYFPKTFFVTRDVPVRLYVTGASKKSLCIMMDSFQVQRQIKTSKIEEITFTPQVPGKYRYYCPINGSEGTMVVKELASTTYSP